MLKPLYVFDMDETLINADCMMIWHQFMVDKGIASGPDFLQEDKRLMKLYSQGKLDMNDYLRFSLAPLANIAKNEVEKLVKECVKQHILDKQFAQSKIVIDGLKRKNIDMVIISASVTFLVEVVGKYVGIENTLGIDLVENDSCYTAEVDGVASYREGKVTRLEQWIAAQSNSYSEVHFFTDSINDLPLCQYADYAYLINPCRRLKEHANQPNWQVLNWS